MANIAVAGGATDKSAEAEPPVEPLQVRLIGTVGAVFQGQTVRIKHRKARAILAYLALSAPPLERRARFAGLLWSEKSPEHAYASLRQCLMELRQALQVVHCPILEITNTHLELHQIRLKLDVADVLAAVEIGEVPDVLLHQSRISDDLLADLDGLDPEWDEWLASQRSAFHRRLLQCMTDRFADASASPSSLRRFAEATLLLDPTNEEACRLVMLCAAQAGETAAALRVYDDLYHVLDREHDMEPATETQELLARIKLGEFESKRLTDVAPGDSTPPRLAVLPFRVAGTDAVPTYVLDGFVEDIVCLLASLREPEVISSNSTRTLRNTDLNLDSIGRMLGARYIVSGLMRPVGSKLRLSVELADAITATVLWKSNHDAEPNQLFDLHDSIVANVAHMLAPRLHQAELRRIRLMRPEHVGAYHLMLQARELIFELKLSSFERAGQLLRDAIELDPEFANSHVTLSNWCSLRLGQGWSPDRSADARLLDKSIRTALLHDPNNAQAMVLLGHNRTLLSRDYSEALRLFSRAVEIAPNDATVWTMSAPTFAFLGDTAEAIRRSERALSLSPRDPFAFRIYHYLSLSHFFNGTHEDAEHWGREALKANPNYTSNLRTLACVLVQQGKLTEARHLAARAMQIQPEFRVNAAVARFASPDPIRRQVYASALLTAGIPA